MNLESIKNGAILKLITDDGHWVTLWQEHDGAPILERWGICNTLEQGRTEVPDHLVDFLVQELLLAGYSHLRERVAQ